MPTPAEMPTRTHLARFEAERLASYLGTLSAEGWNYSTACDLWQVGDVVGHLVWIGEFYVTSSPAPWPATFPRRPARPGTNAMQRCHPGTSTT